MTFRNLHRLMFVILALCTFSMSAQAGGTLVKATEVQIITTVAGITTPGGVDGSAFYANIGSGISSNYFDLLPAGSTFLLRSRIYPANTVNLSSPSYLPPANAKSIGDWSCTGTRAVAFNLASFPAPGTLLEFSNFIFSFNGKNSQSNDVYATGSLIAKTLAPGTPVITGDYGVTGGTGANSLYTRNNLNISIYLDANQTAAVQVVKFTSPIYYYVDN